MICVFPEYRNCERQSETDRYSPVPYPASAVAYEPASFIPYVIIVIPVESVSDAYIEFEMRASFAERQPVEVIYSEECELSLLSLPFLFEVINAPGCDNSDGMAAKATERIAFFVIADAVQPESATDCAGDKLETVLM